MFPVLMTIGDTVIPTYFFIISITTTLCLVWTAKRADRWEVSANSDERLISRKTALDLGMVILGLGIIGARVFHVIFEYPALYAEDPVRIFRLWEGGFVFYGGAIFAAIGGFGFLFLKKQRFGPWMDFAAPLLALGYGLGRVGCFFAGCCFGRACQLPWALKFPPGSEAPVGIAIHPTQIYATVWEASAVVFLLALERASLKKPTGVLARLRVKGGDTFYVWMMLHGLGRIIMEFYRADYRGPELGRLSLSTSISLVIVIIGMLLFLWEPKKEAQKQAFR